MAAFSFTFRCRNWWKTGLCHIKNCKTLKLVNIYSQKNKLTALVLSAGIGLGVEQNKLQQIKLQTPDPSTLTHEYLLRSSSTVMVDSVSSMLTQTTVALSEALREYAKKVWVLITLLEFRLKVLGNVEEETKMDDLILEARATVNEAKEQKQNLEMLMSSVERLVTTAAEVSYIAGSEYASSCASEKVQSLTGHLHEPRKIVDEAESELLQMQLKVIEKETQFQEKKKAESNNSLNENEDLSVEEGLETKNNDNLETKDIFDMSENNNS